MVNIHEVLSVFLPTEWLEYFEVVDINEKKAEWNITLHEKKDCIPKELKGKKVVKDGQRELSYMDRISIIDIF